MLASRPALAMCLACSLTTLACRAGSAPAESAPEAEPASPQPAAPGDPQAGATPTRVEPQAAPAELPVVRIKLPEASMRALEMRRRQALQSGILMRQEGDYVAADVAVDDGAYGPAKVRLKGDWTDHLERDQKWSMRVKVKGVHAIRGMRVFSLQHPDTRGWLSEWQLHDHMQREGVLALRYELVRVELNGTPWGIYALEEHFSKELLEHAQRREGPILKLDEDRLWARMRVFQVDASEWAFMPDDFRLERSEVFRRKKTARAPNLAAARDAAMALLQDYVDGTRSASQVFEVQELARFLAIYELRSASHGIRWHNVRFYYDPVSTRLSPIPFDAHFARPEPLSVVVREPWSWQALEDPVVSAAFLGELQRMAGEDYLDALEAAQKPTAQALFASLRSEWKDAPPPLDKEIREKATLIRQALALDELVRVSARADGSTLTLSLRNTTRLPVEALALRLDTGSDGELREVGRIPLKGAGDGALLLPPFTDAGPPEIQQVRLQLDAEMRRVLAEDATRARGPKLYLEARYVGLELTRSMRVQLLQPRDLPTGLPAAPTVEQALRAHPFLERAEAGALRVRPGQWTVAGDLLLPADTDLELGAGAVLRFAPGAAMVVHGGLRMTGSAEAPAQLLAADAAKGWSGVLVYGGKPSRLEHALVRGAHGIERGGWQLTGGVTFHRSPLVLQDSRIEASNAEDMLNVIGAEVSCLRSVFVGGASDAFDGDWVKADFEECQFNRIAGDAFDVSGSQAQLRDCAMGEIGDKAVSAGEGSHVQAVGLRIAKAKIGIAAKDLAQVDAERITLSAVQIGFAAFQKKAEYGPGTLVVREVRAEQGGVTGLSLLGSRVEIDGDVVPESGAEPPGLDLLALLPGAPAPDAAAP